MGKRLVIDCGGTLRALLTDGSSPRTGPPPALCAHREATDGDLSLCHSKGGDAFPHPVRGIRRRNPRQGGLR
jgi:hypothetical protein